MSTTNTNNGYIKSLSDLTSNDFINSSSSPSSSSNYINNDMSSTGSFFTWQTVLIILLILILLGINIVGYIFEGAIDITAFIARILKYFGYQTLETTKQTVDVIGVGTQKGLNIITDKTVDVIDKSNAKIDDIREKREKREKPNYKGVESSKSTSNLDTISKDESDNEDEHDTHDKLDKALKDATLKSSKVVPDDAKSSIQYVNKPSWCYVGDDKNVRVCSKIGVNDQCLSGDIFPSKDVCINPKLRT